MNAERSFVYRQSTAPVSGADIPKAHVLTLATLAAELRSYSERAEDDEARCYNDKDEGLLGALGVLIALADKYVWTSSTDFDDEAGLEDLKSACERANRAVAFLRSGAAGVQRKLTTPSGEDLAFIRERWQVQSRKSSPYCRIADERTPGVIEFLRVPGPIKYSVKQLLYKCSSLAQAQRVLSAIGLSPKIEGEGEQAFLRVQDERIVRRKL